jgi:4-hydroxy-3-methylbut-2-en-1-yl diphosphate synthase IspG/GcpE
LKRATRSLLEELNSIADKKHSEAVIETRAAHVIDSAINLLNLIKEQYTPDEAYELERRLINSIKGSDPNKFVRSIRRLRDSKETAKHLKIVEGDLKDDE